MTGDGSDRDSLTARLGELAAVDVLVVGGGINGCATFRELALQGLRCLIVDREDFGAGASSASSRMAHGGLRYLENGAFRLVAEATRERNRLLRNAAHAVSPLLVTIPSFSVFGGLAQSVAKLFGIARGIPSRGVVLLKLGLALYDFLGRRQAAMGRHRMTFGAAARALLPDLHPAVRGLASYYDAKISHAERIAFELVADGLAANPRCLALNHCALLQGDGPRLVLRDLLGGRDHAVAPRLVVNATGAWIDTTNQRIGAMRPLIGGTKGSHLVLDNPALHGAMRGRAFSFDDGGGRMCIAYPLGEMVLLGTTDIRVADPDAAVCDEAEIDYLLGAIRVIFPMIEVGRAQIRFRFCGVRPLPRSATAATVDISRDHSIVRREPDAAAPYPVLSLVGGKWTTFRAFAEQAADQVLAALGASRTRGTRDLPIGGGRDFPTDAGARRAWIERVGTTTGCASARVDALLSRYGTRAEDVAAFCAAAPDRPLAGAPDYSEREMLFLVRHEMAATLDDIVYRRTTLAMWGRLSFPLLCDLAGIVAQARGVAAAGLLHDLVARLLRENGIDFRAELRRRAGAPGEPGTPEPIVPVVHPGYSF
jgi:glycerol-3-phosphate dehydrogenase